MNDAQKEEFRRQAFIPEDVSLELENFDEFYEKRKEILTVKIRELLGWFIIKGLWWRWKYC